MKHNKELCDKCQEAPARIPCPFLYMDHNDSEHPEVRKGGYRQYWLCDSCFDMEQRILGWNNCMRTRIKREIENETEINVKNILHL